jgi:hypothetical protein
MKKLNLFLLAGLMALPLIAKADDMSQPASSTPSTSTTGHKKHKNVSTHRHKKNSKKKAAKPAESTMPSSSQSNSEPATIPAESSR